IIRTFIEDYHEQLEEDYLFPRFEKAKRLTELTQVLRAEHQAGRRVTEQITRLATVQTLKDPRAATTLRDAMHQFVRMYGPHEAREDTVLFPALRTVVSNQEFGALGVGCGKNEDDLLGEHAQEAVVGRLRSGAAA